MAEATLNLRVEGSIPSRLTKLSSALSPRAKYLKNGAVAAVRLPISIERDAFGEEQLLKALSLIEGRVHPQVCGAR